MVVASMYVGRMASWASCAPLAWVWYWRVLLYLSPQSLTISSRLAARQSVDRLTESVRMYVIRPLS